MSKTKKTCEQSMLDRILYIGNDWPEGLLTDKRDKFILLGCPQDVIDEVDNTGTPKSVHEMVCWIAEYSYQKANDLTVGEPPSIVYEQVARDFNRFLTS